MTVTMDCFDLIALVNKLSSDSDITGGFRVASNLTTTIQYQAFSHYHLRAIMRHLPLELQLLVIENLDARDIFSLQLTCKSFNALIESSAELVWKHCLQNRCRQNELFQASFKDLRVASQFKSACTASSQLVKAYRNALDNTKGILKTPSVTPLTVIQITEQPVEADISDIFLLPGGRFLATFQQSRWLSIWDLRQPCPPDSTPSTSSFTFGDDTRVVRPTLLLRRTIEAFDALAYIDSCVDGNTVRFLLKAFKEIPGDLASLVQDDVSGELLPVYELHQVNMQDGTASIERIGELIVLYDNSEDPIKLTVALSESEILFQADSWSLIWDVSRKQVSAWAIEGVTNVSHAFTYSNYVFYINVDGVHGVERPPFEPLEKNWFAVPPPYSPDALRPSFFFPHEIKHIFTTGDQVSGPDICNPRIRERPQDFFYEITEFEELKDVDGKVAKSKLDQTPISVYRYLFSFDPIHPEESTLTLTESAAVRRPPGSGSTPLPPGAEVELVPGPYQLSDHRLGCIWMEDMGSDEVGWRTKSLYFSLSSPFERVSGPIEVQAPPLSSSSGAPRTRSKSKWRLNDGMYKGSPVTQLRLVKFWDLPSSNDDDDDGQSVLACEFCPTTARVALLLDNNAGTYVAIFDLLGLEA